MKLLRPLLFTTLLSTAALAQPPLPPGPPHGDSRVVRLTGSTLELGRERGWSHLTQLDGHTKIHRGAAAASLADLAPGVALHVHDSLQTDGSYLADDVDIEHNPPLAGKVLTRTGDGLTLSVHGLPVPVLTNPQTVWRYGWLPGPAGLVSAGSHVHVESHVVAGQQVADVVQTHFPWMPLSGGLLLAGAAGLAAQRRRRQPAAYVPGQFD